MVKGSKFGKLAWNKGNRKPNSGSFTKGHSVSEKIKQRVSKAQTGRKQTQERIEQRVSQIRGDKHWNWQDGKSFELYGFDFTKELKTIIRKRDKFVCFICLKNGFDVHHIDYNKRNCDPKNLITLCRKCHMKTNHNREYWKKYFKGHLSG